MTDDTLAATPTRALQLLSAVATVPAIGAAMATRGYSKTEHDEGWQLLQDASGRARPLQPPSTDKRVRAAMDEIDAWDEDGFAIAEASLSRHYPAQAAFVLADLHASRGAGAVLGVKTFLDRLDALDHDPEREATREKDHGALRLLAERGITAEERRRLAALVEIATSVAPVDAHAQRAEEHSRQELHEALVRLRAWYDEWSAVGRRVVKRRDHLIRMGLAQRKTKDTPEPEGT
jgi:hypothetical protein